LSTKAYIGLGSNLGDPLEQLLKARRLLFSFDQVIDAQSSSIYVSTPVGYADQPDYANCVLELTVSCSYRDLFEKMQLIEVSMGRKRDPANQNAPRVIDIDLLLFGRQLIDEPDLVVPHPRVSQRLFVLLPLAELAPGLVNDIWQGQLSEINLASVFDKGIGYQISRPKFSSTLAVTILTKMLSVIFNGSVFPNTFAKPSEETNSPSR